MSWNLATVWDRLSLRIVGCRWGPLYFASEESKCRELRYRALHQRHSTPCDQLAMDHSNQSKFNSNRVKESEALSSISDILQTGLNKRILAVLRELIESGVEPDSLLDGQFFCSCMFPYFWFACNRINDSISESSMPSKLFLTDSCTISNSRSSQGASC